MTNEEISKKEDTTVPMVVEEIKRNVRVEFITISHRLTDNVSFYVMRTMEKSGDGIKAPLSFLEEELKSLAQYCEKVAETIKGYKAQIEEEKEKYPNVDWL